MIIIGFHLETSRRFILQAEAALIAGDEIQASEKAWGAAAHAIKAVAELYRWPHESHADLFRAVNNIVRISGDPEIRTLFGMANSLHQNFYEGWLDAEYIAGGIEDVKRLLTKLDAFMADGGNGAGV